MVPSTWSQAQFPEPLDITQIQESSAPVMVLLTTDVWRRVLTWSVKPWEICVETKSESCVSGPRLASSVMLLSRR